MFTRALQKSNPDGVKLEPNALCPPHRLAAWPRGLKMDGEELPTRFPSHAIIPKKLACGVWIPSQSTVKLTEYGLI